MQADNPLRQGLARVDIEVIDVNDNLPIFDKKIYNISILENAPNGFSVTQIHAHDADIVSFEMYTVVGNLHIPRHAYLV